MKLEVTALKLNGQEAAANAVVGANQQLQAQVTVSEPDGDTRSYAWEVRLLVYVLDCKGHAGTANFRFRVD